MLTLNEALKYAGMPVKEAKTPQQFEDTDAVAEKLADMGSAADIWMGEPQLKKLMKHLNDGGKVKCLSISTPRARSLGGRDKQDKNDMMDKRTKTWTDKGWTVFDYEWDGDDESVDVVLTK